MTGRSDNEGSQHRIRFFNTFEPVTSFYRDLLPALTRVGFSCDVIISRASYRSERPLLVDSIADHAIRYQRMPAIFAQSNSRVAKITAAGLYVVFASLVSLLGRSTDVNFFMTQPPLYSIWGMVLKAFRGQKYVCLLMDVYPDVAIESGLLRRNGWIARLTQSMVRASWRRADAVIVIGRCMAQRVIDSGVSPDHVHQIHNWSDEDHVFPIEAKDNPLREELGLIGKFVVLYSGNMGVSHTFDEIAEVARRLKSDPQIRFVFVGRGSRRKEIEKAIKSEQLSNVLLLPFQPPEQLAISLSLADIHLVTLRSGFAGLVVPSKTYGALASGRPILYVGEVSGEIAQMVTDHHAGQAVPLEEPDMLQMAIMAYRDNPEKTKMQGQNALRVSHSLFDRQSALEWYASLLRQVADQMEKLELPEASKQNT